MTTPDTTGDGLLVVDDTGTVSWWSARPAAVAPVDVTIGPGAVVQVDASYPAQVLNWILAPGADPAVLATAVGDPDLAATITALAGAGEGTTPMAAPQLTPPWARRAEVAAVTRWTMRPLHEGALMLDDAASEYRTGNTLAASRLFALASPTLFDLGEQCLDGTIRGGPAGELREITRIAEHATTGTGWGPEVLALAAALQDHSDLDDDWALAALLTTQDLSSADATRGVSDWGSTGTEVSITTTALDPHTVPPRILGWSGAETYELLVEYREDADTVTVTATLAATVDPLCLEAQQLLAYAADRATGAVTACAPMQVQGRAVVATLPCRGRHPDTLHIGVYYVDTELDELRPDELGQLLTDVDRRMLEAWNHHRTALAAVHAVPADADADLWAAAAKLHKKQIDQAYRCAHNAASKIRAFVATHPDIPGDVVAALNARRAVILDYRNDLDAAAPTRTTDTHPLLAEMLPVEPWDEEIDR